MFYTYMYLRENGTPYYVGKGHGNRAYAKHGRLAVPPIDRMVFYVAKDEAEAFENEVALIWYYGRKDNATGILRNLTAGGENPPSALGKKRTEETKKKMSTVRMGMKLTEEHIRNSAKARTGMPWSKAQREASRSMVGTSNPFYGKKHSEDTKAKWSQKRKGQKPTEETIRKRSLALTGRARSEETKRKISAGHKRRTQEKKKYEQPINTTETRLESQ